MKLFCCLSFLFIVSVCSSQVIIRIGSNGSVGGSTVTQSQLDDSAAAIRGALPKHSQVSIPSQKFITVADSGKYITSTVIIQDDDAGLIYMFYNLSQGHVYNGKMYMQKSRDGEIWSSPEQPIINGSVVNNVGLISLGVGNNNRLIVRYQRGPNPLGDGQYDTIFTTYSDDYGVTFSNPTYITVRGTQSEIAPYGSIVKVKGDTIYSPMYANFSVDTAQAYYDISYDNGATWPDYYVIMKGLISGTFPTGGSINETWMLKVKEGVSHLTTPMVAFIRWQKVPGYHYQWYRDSTGIWTSVAVEQGAWMSEYFQTSGSAAFPVSAQIVHDSIIQVYVGFRGNNVTGLNSGFKVIEGPLQAYRNPSLFSKPRTLYTPLSYKAQLNDDGYLYPFKVNNKPMVGAYDITAEHKSGSSQTTTKTRGILLPVDGNNYLELYDTSAQSIPTGEETRVLTRITRLDSDLMYNSDSSKVYIKYDGWYNFNAWVTFDANAGGTYRRATLWMVDPGDETGPSPTSANGKIMISQSSIPSSSNSEFNRIELNGGRFCYKGMEIRLTVQHDVGSNIDIINTNPISRATINAHKSFQ